MPGILWLSLRWVIRRRVFIKLSGGALNLYYHRSLEMSIVHKQKIPEPGRKRRPDPGIPFFYPVLLHLHPVDREAVDTRVPVGAVLIGGAETHPVEVIAAF